MRSTRLFFMLGVLAMSLAAPSLFALQTVRVIVFPGGFNWPIWAAQQQGFFEDQGIRVAVTPTPSSVYQMRNLIDGKFDIAMTAFDNVVAYDSGEGAVATSRPADLVAFMGGDDGFLSLVVQNKIHTFADLKNRTLSVDALTTGYAFVLRRMLAEHGLPEGSYKLKSAGGVLQRWSSLLAGKFAGTLLVTPFDILARAKGLHPLSYAINDLGSYQGVVGAARTEWATAHKSELVAYIRAYRRALDWLYNRANRSAALAILEAKVPHMTPTLASKTYDVLLGKSGGFFRDANLSMAGVRTVLELRKRYGTDKPILNNPKNFYNLSYYEAATK